VGDGYAAIDAMELTEEELLERLKS
jgi:hypothetical protein